jgi:hypothetical protein
MRCWRILLLRSEAVVRSLLFLVEEVFESLEDEVVASLFLLMDFLPMLADRGRGA